MKFIVYYYKMMQEGALALYIYIPRVRVAGQIFVTVWSFCVTQFLLRLLARQPPCSCLNEPNSTLRSVDSELITCTIEYLGTCREVDVGHPYKLFNHCCIFVTSYVFADDVIINDVCNVNHKTQTVFMSVIAVPNVDQTQ